MVDPVKTQTHRPHRRKVLAGMAATLGAIGVAGGGAVFSPFDSFPADILPCRLKAGINLSNKRPPGIMFLPAIPRAKLDGYAVLPG